MKQRLRGFRLSPAGGGLVLVLAAAVAVLAVGPYDEQVPAIIVIAIVVLVLVAQPGGSRAAWSRTLDERREEFGAHSRDPAEEAEQDERWARERERYER